MNSKKVKEIAEWIVWCAKENCDKWGESYSNTYEALSKSHDSTYMEDEKDMIEEMGFTKDEIIKAWDYLLINIINKKEYYNE
jgi:Holliday junction resolvasome RuvABC DNA-binding subunit